MKEYERIDREGFDRAIVLAVKPRFLPEVWIGEHGVVHLLDPRLERVLLVCQSLVLGLCSGLA